MKEIRDELDEQQMYMVRLETLVNEHQVNFQKDKIEDSSNMFEKEDGVTRQYGVKMNKFGKILEMTKPQILRLIIDINERVSNFDDEIKEVSLNYSMLEE